MRNPFKKPEPTGRTIQVENRYSEAGSDEILTETVNAVEYSDGSTAPIEGIWHAEYGLTEEEQAVIADAGSGGAS